MSNPTVLPQITVQPTYPSVLADVASALVPSEDFWVSCYSDGRPSVHGKVRVTRERDAQSGCRLEARGGVEVEWVGSAALRISCPALNIPPTIVRLPRQSIPVTPAPSQSQAPTQITTFDIASDLSLLAAGHPSGSLTLLPLPSHPHPPQQTNGHTPSSAPIPAAGYNPTLHLSTVLSTRILPSSRVLLTSASDALVHVTSTSPPHTPARTLKGHKRGVTDTAIVGVGKTVLSCAKDGTARVWDVGGAKCTRTLAMPSYSAANKMALAAHPPSPDLSYLSPTPIPAPPPTSDPTLLALALQSGSYTLFSLSSPLTPLSSSQLNPSHPLQSIALSPTTPLLATGSSHGLLTIHDIRSLPTPLHTIKRNGSSIEEVVFVGAEELVVGGEDGLPWRVRLGGGEVGVGEEFGGWECDAVRCVRAVGGSVWMGGDDGVVRRY